MLRVTIETMPGGSLQGRVLRTIEITNRGVRHELTNAGNVIASDECDYSVAMFTPGCVDARQGSFVHRGGDGLEVCVRKAMDAITR